MLFQKLTNEGIGLSVHYTPLHLLSYYRKFLKKKDSFPVATRVYEEILSLPLYPTLTHKDVDFVTTKMKMPIVNAPMS
jgi:dTDP-4-amino-4,6-dideoxygalactose transaminase